MAYGGRLGGKYSSERGAVSGGHCCAFWRGGAELISEDRPIRIRQVRPSCAPPLVILHRIPKLTPLLNAARTDSNQEASCRTRERMTVAAALLIRISSQLYGNSVPQ